MVVFLTKLFYLFLTFIGACSVLAFTAVALTIVSMGIGVARDSKFFTITERFFIILFYSGVLAWAAWLDYVVGHWTIHWYHLAAG